MTATPLLQASQRANCVSAPAQPASTITLVAWSMVAIQSVVVAWACFRGFYYFSDDYVFRGRGAALPWLSPEYLLDHWGGHFMPAAFLAAQPFAKLTNFGYGWVALSLALGQLLVAVLLLRTLFRHFGRRWRVLLPLAIYLTAVPVVQASTWWAAALNMVPLMACTVIVVDRTLRTHGGRNWSSYVWILSTTLVGLLFFEKAVLLHLLVLGVLWALTPVQGLQSFVSVVRVHWPVLVGLSTALVGWAVLYTVTKGGPTFPWPGLDAIAAQSGNTMMHGVLPSFLGGPWEWFRAGLGGYDLARTSPLIQMVAACSVTTVVVLCWISGSRARRALSTLFVYAAANLVLLSVGRPYWGAGEAALPRYTADLSVVAALMVALATTRIRDDPAPAMLVERNPRPSPRVVLALVLVAQLLVLVWVGSTARLVQLMGTSPDRPWVEAALASMRATPDRAPILDRNVPRTVMNPLLPPNTLYSWFFAGTGGIPPISDETDRLRVLDDRGALVEAHVKGPTALQGPVPGCGWRVDERGTSVPLQADVIPWVHTVQVAYVSNQPSPLEVSFAEGTPRTLSVVAGLHDAYANIAGGGRTMTLRATSPGALICVGAIRVGEPVPGPLPAEAQP